MPMVIPVMEFLAKVVGSYKFGAENSAANRSNFRCHIENDLVIECDGGKYVAIPEGSTLVVYRSPRKTHAKGLTIGCFHHADGKRQTTIYAGGVGKTRELGGRSLMDGRRRMPRLHLSSD